MTFSQENPRKPPRLKYDLIGQTYGDFEILRFLGHQRWLLRCRHCQHEVERFSQDIRRGWARRTCPRCNAGNDVGLTRMEYKVALLVAQGLTNKQIVTELVISDRTVQTHLTNIYAKLNLTNRTPVGHLHERKASRNNE